MTAIRDIFDTDHPVALVTGSGAARVGNAIVRDLAEAGCVVIIHARTSLAAAEETAAMLRAKGARASVVQADVGEAADVERMFGEIDAHHERLDILVNSAAIYPRIPLEQITADDVLENFRANALGSFLCCQAAGQRMVHQPQGGAIVNIGDWSTVRPYRDFAAYFPSKGAIPVMTRSLAVELAARNPSVRVNAILPGPVLFPPDMTEADRRTQIERTLVKRAGTPHDVAHAVRFLIENGFVTGVCLPVDGGRTIYAGLGTDQQFTE